MCGDMLTRRLCAMAALFACAVSAALVAMIYWTPMDQSVSTDELRVPVGGRGAVDDAGAVRERHCTCSQRSVHAVRDEPSRDCVDNRWTMNCSGCAGRALVMIMLRRGHEGDPPTAEPEILAYFARHGLYGDAESTQRFAHIDFVYHRANPARAGRSSAVAAIQGNVRLVWTPPVPCDWCGHATVVRDLFDGVAGLRLRYEYAVFMNTDVRGPFRASFAPRPRPPGSMLPRTFPASRSSGRTRRRFGGCLAQRCVLCSAE